MWDQDGQIAIQSPSGGTKIAWDGDAEPTAPGWNRQGLDLVAADVQSELPRLTGLGARARSTGPDVAMLTDPDGAEFTLSRG